MKKSLKALVDHIVTVRGDKQCFVVVAVPDGAFCTVEDIRRALPVPDPIPAANPEDRSLFPRDKFPTAMLADARDFYHDRDIDSNVPVLFYDEAADKSYLAAFVKAFKPVRLVCVKDDGFWESLAVFSADFPPK